MTEKFRPMLSDKTPTDLSKLRYPVLASPKLDGIRCVKLNGRALTRKLKPVPNDFARTWIEENLPDGIDGELLLRDWTAPFNEVSSAIMSKEGEPDFTFAAFDIAGMEAGFQHRLRELKVECIEVNDPEARLHVVHHELATNQARLVELYECWLEAGLEGAMVRDPEGPYKQGRSTTREGYLLKMKLFDDEEATVIGLEEQMHNANELEQDELGYAKRSSAKAGKVGKGTLGKLICRFDDGTEFRCGTGKGLTKKLRQEIWDDVVPGDEDSETEMVHAVVGARVKIKFQPPPSGRKPGEKPRLPVFLGFRHEDDS